MIGPLSYIGGKRRLASTLLRLIPTDHITYVELFAGGAQLFFHKPASRVEVLNDLDDEIVNFLRICQRHPSELARLLRFSPPSRQLFAWCAETSNASLTDIERAARFFYLQANGWSGKRHHRTFHYGIGKRPGYRPAALPRRLLEAADRLANVQVERLSYQAALAKYDRPGTFFYCDPPYVGARLYQHNFTDEAFEELADHLARLAGRFLLSINDCPEARRCFGTFHCLPVNLTYTATSQPRQYPELLFANYPLSASARRP